ncbi:MAG TPA: hypothetical protein VML55_11510 [Planctomycetaceae bacterium]|nr:hypothetical protein [Planctomycetaceae bacterium]
MQLLASIVRLIRSWWRVDRIRISAAEGRLLRLEPGALLTIDGQPVEVVERRAPQQPDQTLIEYDCRTAAAPCRLFVRQSAAGGGTTVEWRRGDNVARLDELEVIVWRNAISMGRSILPGRRDLDS